MELPRFIAIKSISKSRYLLYVDEENDTRGYLHFLGEDIRSPFVKFQVEPAKNDNGSVHIRCCYNNKYWTTQSQDRPWIVAAADEPEEDRSKWSCTLFESVQLDSKPNQISLRHVQLKHYAFYDPDSSTPNRCCLYAGSTTGDHEAPYEYEIIDLSSMLVLPKYIALKGDNDRFVSVWWFRDNFYLQFSGYDIGDPTMGIEVVTHDDGTVSLKSFYTGKFWKTSPYWIWPESDADPADDTYNRFQPIKIDDNTISLKHVGVNRFCMRLSADGVADSLNAGSPTIMREARLVVKELVISRNIYNVDFHLSDAKIYNQSMVTMTTGCAVNQTHEIVTVDVKLSFQVIKSTSWSNKFTLGVGIKSTIESGIPIFAEGKIEVSVNVSGSYQWGGTVESKTVFDTIYHVVVPPMSQVKVSVLATKAAFEVPFSYVQRETLIDGRQSLTEHSDGLYTGDSCYDFKYESYQEPL